MSVGVKETWPRTPGRSGRAPSGNIQARRCAVGSPRGKWIAANLKMSVQHWAEHHDGCPSSFHASRRALLASSSLPASLSLAASSRNSFTLLRSVVETLLLERALSIALTFRPEQLFAGSQTPAHFSLVRPGSGSSCYRRTQELRRGSTLGRCQPTKGD